jgi:Ca2+-binding EF-hand superfamily protein
MFDKNGDQKISESELLQVMKYLGLKTSESDVKAMIQVVDKNSKNIKFNFSFKLETYI